MAQHEYKSFSNVDIEPLLRNVEAHEGQEWELVTILRRSFTLWQGFRGEFVAILRRPANRGHEA